MFQGKSRLEVVCLSTAISLIYLLSQVVVTSYSFSPETMEVGQKPWGAAVDERTNKIYVVNWGSDNVSIIDGNTDTILETVNTTPKSLYATINDKTNSVYVTGSQFGKTTIFNTNNSNAIQTLNLSVGYMVVNQLTNKIYAIKNGQYPDTGSILIINGSTNQVLSEISEVNQIEALSINEDQNVLYAAKWGEAITTSKVASYIYFINGTKDQIFSQARIEGRALALAFDPIPNKLFIATTLPSQVSVMDVKTHEILTTIPIGSGLASPNCLAINKSTGMVFAVSGHRLYAINATNNAVSGLAGVGGYWGIAVNSNSGKLYVSNSDWNSITIFDTNVMKKPDEQHDTSSTNNILNQIVVTPLSYWLEIKIVQAISCMIAGGLTASILTLRWRKTGLVLDKNEGSHSVSRWYQQRQNLPHIIVPIFLLALAAGGLFVTSYIWYSFAAYSGPAPSGGGAIIEAFLYVLISMWFLVLSIPTVIGSVFLLRGSGKGYYLSLIVLVLWTLNIIWGMSIAFPRERNQYWYLLALPAITLVSAMYPFLLLGKRIHFAPRTIPER